MSPTRPLPCFALLLAAAVLPPSAQGQASVDAATAVCERSARQTLASQAAPTEVVFTGSASLDASLSNDSQVVLRGSGRSRSAAGTRSFGYSCTVDLRTNEAVGLVLRDIAPAVVKAAPARPPAEPDLSALSPTACESSAVEALRKRWPRVAKITFDTGSRRFSQPSTSVAQLHGSGLAQPMPGAPNTVFSFECAIDPHDGWVIRTTIAG
ncbi:MAG: hypothetical protein ABIO71_05720 [Caldimonas sp.]